MTARRPLAAGDIIHGFAFGAFGRDHYDCVRIEAVGPDWIIARGAADDEDKPGPAFAAGARSLSLCAQARDEGHKTPWGEPEQVCPLAGLSSDPAHERLVGQLFLCTAPDTGKVLAFGEVTRAAREGEGLVLTLHPGGSRGRPLNGRVGTLTL
ncbi:hypothetical protein [Streptomyces sp. NPDC005953]|uniref:hypothetical protein n=1 Tax=Streptomyces sp. NPDC005953 TaxID=3156719 RepID=UPI0033C90655